MKIGDRVAYTEENEALGLVGPELHGTVVEPTRQDLNDGAAVGDVFIEWDDGERFWEDPASLVVVEKEDR